MAKIIKTPIELQVLAPGTHEKWVWVKQNAWINPDCVSDIAPYHTEENRAHLLMRSGRSYVVPLKPDSLVVALFPFSRGGTEHETVRMSENPFIRK